MPYIGVRGNLGLANTRVYGLTNREIDKMKEVLRISSRNDEKCEVVFYNAVMYLVNQLEYHLGYAVVGMATTDDQLVWTLYKMPGESVERKPAEIVEIAGIQQNPPPLIKHPSIAGFLKGS